MGDFVSKQEVDKIREHYYEYSSSNLKKHTSDNRAAPASGVYDADSFRECSTWYINRLLRYIEVEDMIAEVQSPIVVVK